MLLNLSDIGESDYFDFCIIGTGPAGITTALDLSNTGKKILLVEGGGLEPTIESQGLYEGTVIGDKYLSLETCRLRYFGGTSNHWSGVCRTFDEIDFNPRNLFEDNKWPIKKIDLDPYLTEALNILEAPKILPDERGFGKNVKLIHFVKSPPVRFKEKYFNHIKNSQNIFLTLNTNCLNFGTKNNSISHVVLLKKNTKKKIKSKNFILATGGIENSRILLWSNELNNNQIVKNNKVLGRYWMEHPNFDIGEAVIFDKNKYDYFSNHFAITDKKKIELGILNARIGFLENKQSLIKNMKDLQCLAPKLSNIFKFNKDVLCGSKIRGVWEQEPNFDNKIELSNEKDSIGMPKVKLHWKKTKNDFKTIRKTLETIAEAFIINNLGRIKIYPFVESGSNYPTDHNLVSSHHIGGTRMSNNLSTGVVDQNCKVFGQSNLFVIGSSIFPTGGYTNPTLPIVQFSLRLSEYLKNRNI